MKKKELEKQNFLGINISKMHFLVMIKFLADIILNQFFEHFLTFLIKPRFFLTLWQPCLLQLKTRNGKHVFWYIISYK